MHRAEKLIESMTTERTDGYRDVLENLIEEKIEHGEKAAAAPAKRAPRKKKAA